ncbi:MAG: hypoxanthine phosphoribosyltransferase [Proteobacteria bacterium]|nr:hypoxanthine phosphoribosyltransferase [Pseudomonadota bacterium]MBU1687627.1 hypoxanthine phosphoribosyltransferase [Pseudomonadota bacterium]
MGNKEICLSRETIAQRVRDLGEEIDRDYPGGSLLVVGVLTGAFIFTADLVRAVSVPLEVDFIRLASYGTGTSPGELRLTKDIETEVRGRDLLLVEDIVDTGRTLAWLVEFLAKKEPKSIKICALIDKRERREKEIRIDYPGFTVEQGFLVGYGLDYAGRDRHLPGIYRMKSTP